MRKKIDKLFDDVMRLIVEKADKLPLDKYSVDVIESVYREDAKQLQKIKRELEKIE